jgi:type I restriction enzyme R subunit
VATLAELIARWLRPEQRAEIRERLMEEGIDFEALATALGMPEADPFDLLLQIAFGQQVMTRRGRAEKLRREHADFFRRYGPAARVILNVILDKYIAGEAPDVSDTQLLRVPPLSERGTFIELAKPFGGGQFLRNALKEMQTLLYSA